MDQGFSARKAATYAGPLLVLAVWLSWMAPGPPAHLSPSLWLLVGLSGLANIGVVVYHKLVPAHPKFSIVPWRRFVLWVHITSGIAELLAGVAAIVIGVYGPAAVWAEGLPFGAGSVARVMAAVAFFFHVPSALVQASGVFGSRAVMRPAYLMCIVLHAYTAVHLALDPGTLYWVVATFVMFNTYVWVRIYYFVLDKLNLFDDSKYTVAVLAAGLTTTPVVLGPEAMLVIGVSLGFFIVLHTAFFIRSPRELRDFMRERARDSAYSPELQALWRSDKDERELAQSFFRVVDRDNDGAISAEEVGMMLAGSALPISAIQQFMSAKSDGGRMSFEPFLQHLWSIQELRQAARQVIFTRGGERSEHDKADFVFRLLDLDGNNVIDRTELQSLLNEWSMPPKEAQRWTRSLGIPDDEDIDFDTFFNKMRPIWRFIYYDVVEARYGKQEDLLARVITRWQDEEETRRLAMELRKGKLRGLPFMRTADDELLLALAAAFVEQRAEPGTVLFAEGDLGEDFWVLLSGEVEVRRGEARLATLREGDCLGEGALLADRPRSATAVVRAPSALLRASSRAFRFLLDQHPALHAELVRMDEQRRASTTLAALRSGALGRSGLFQDLDEAALLALAARLSRRDVQERAPIFAEGDPADGLYLVESGAVEIIQGETTLAELGAGAFFGELALVEGRPRGATAVGLPGAVLYFLPRADFEALFADSPRGWEALATRTRLRRMLQRGGAEAEDKDEAP